MRRGVGRGIWLLDKSMVWYFQDDEEDRPTFYHWVGMKEDECTCTLPSAFLDGIRREKGGCAPCRAREPYIERRTRSRRGPHTSGNAIMWMAFSSESSLLVIIVPPGPAPPGPAPQKTYVLLIYCTNRIPLLYAFNLLQIKVNIIPQHVHHLLWAYMKLRRTVWVIRCNRRCHGQTYTNFPK